MHVNTNCFREIHVIRAWNNLLWVSWGLFKYLCHGSAYPYLWAFQTEDMEDGRSAVELHHAFLKLAAFLHALTGDDERCIHFFQRLTAMAEFDTSMVSGYDEDTVFIDTGILGGLDNFADVAIQFG